MKNPAYFFLLLVTAFSFMNCLQIDAISIKRGPYLQNVYQDEATIVWISSKNSVGWVEIAPNDGTVFYSCEREKIFDTEVGVKRVDTLHVVHLKGLKPGTTYRYRVYSQEVLSHKGHKVLYGDVAATDVYRKLPLEFQTLPADAQTTSFVVLNDVHARKDVITPLLRFAEVENRDLVFFNGDMVSIVNTGDDFFTGFMNECVDVFAKKKSFYYVRGNHETRGQFAVNFQRFFSPKQPNLYFTMHHGPVYFIILDTGEDKPDSDIEYSGITDYDNYRSQQKEWLKTVAQDSLFKKAKYRVVIAHMPTTCNKQDWHGTLDCFKKFTPILNEMDIDVMLCGHVHRDIYHKATENVKYPIIVNSNNGSLEADADDKELRIKVRHIDGKVVATYNYKSKR